ncbi:hypothetical protein HYH03_004640 [Edaphochlamys debaryana]|uniref:Uncharacterized protein n=1 Tax=Edaphochlamys debaryana TaxID=47281 RepID=A0A836C354_9CHLO|nr:hypothetical protein HYH03_004640 [Edaphochlamys debaryana]|eukprot:KAG2497487.1 hypothetical protein HYH03_004640 [Edaphochlamys debaryana]
MQGRKTLRSPGEPLWQYVPGSNRGVAAAGTKQRSPVACGINGRVPLTGFAVPNLNYCPEYELTLEELGDILIEELPAAVGWAPPTSRLELVGDLQLKPGGYPTATIRTARQSLRHPRAVDAPWRP